MSKSSVFLVDTLPEIYLFAVVTSGGRLSNYLYQNADAAKATDQAVLVSISKLTAKFHNR